MQHQMASIKFKILNKFYMMASPPWNHENKVSPSPAGDCVVIAEMGEDVMLNLFQHLIKSIPCETLK